MNFLRKKAPAATVKDPVNTQAHVEGAPAPKAAASQGEPKADGDAGTSTETPGIEDRIGALEQQNTELQNRCATLESRVTALEAATDDETDDGEDEAGAQGTPAAPAATVTAPAPKAETPAAPAAPGASTETAPKADEAPKTRDEFLRGYNAITDPMAASRYFDTHGKLLR